MTEDKLARVCKIGVGIFVAVVLVLVGLNNMEVRLRYYGSVDAKNLDLSDCRLPYDECIWMSIGGIEGKKEMENELKINLPNINSGNEYMYLGLGRKIKRIKYSLLVKFFSHYKGTDVYPDGKATFYDDGDPNRIYIGDKFIPKV